MADPVGRVSHDLRQNVGVLGRHADLRVAEDLHHDPLVDPLGEQEGSRGMPRIVNSRVSISPISPRRSASTTRALTRDCWTSAGSSFSRWSQRGAGTLTTQFPNGRGFGEEFLRSLRKGSPCRTLDTVTRRLDGL